jgi:hypothetical protein
MKQMLKSIMKSVKISKSSDSQLLIPFKFKLRGDSIIKLT